MNQEIRFCVTSDNVRLAYARAGQGPPLVRVGTWLTHLEFHWNSPLWRPWLDNLSRFHTFYRYDPRGCGLSDWNVGHFSVDAFVSDLETVVDAAGLEKFSLFGMSQGGCIAIIYAARHPERVSHLIICGGYLHGMARRRRNVIDNEEHEIYEKVIRLAFSTSNPAYQQVLSTELLPDGTSEQIGWLNELQHISTSPDNAVRIQETFNLVDVSELAANVRVPTLVLHATGDVAVPFEEGRLIATHIANARLVPLDARNHFLQPSDHAWEQLWREFYGFFGMPGPNIEGQSHNHTTLEPLNAVAQLTLREREILHLLAQGYRNEEIARSLVLTPKTVRNYVSRIYEKLNVSSRGEAIVLAHKAGFGSRQ